MELTYNEQVELRYLAVKGFKYLIRNEIGSVEAFVAEPVRDKVTNDITNGGYDTWVERAYPMTREEINRRRKTELGKYEFIQWNDEPMLINILINP